MRKITIIGTMHNELGQCNQSQLLAIIKALDPDVIFEEIRPEDHERLYRDVKNQTVEMKAICSYMSVGYARQIPVDDFSIPAGFRKGVDELFAYVEEGCKEYRAVVSNIDRLAFNYGYRFLSSLKHIELRNKADEIFEGFIASSNSAHLKSLLSAWYLQLRKRESAMLGNIYDFCRRHAFKNGVYLVGAGHMSYLAKSLEARVEAEPELVNWHVWGG